MIIDLGSSTIKVYSIGNETPELIRMLPSPLNSDLDIHTKLNEITNALSEFKHHKPTIIATSAARKLAVNHQKELIEKVEKELELELTIIDQDSESTYLREALIGRLHTNKPVMLLNIGGGSTEILTLKDGQTIGKVNLEIGVGTILKQYQDINECVMADNQISEIKSFIQRLLPNKKMKAKIAFYTGGELNYMRLLEYPLVENNLMSDPDHPSIIGSDDFKTKNHEVLSNVTISELKELMPESPDWMNGARACTILAETIFDAFEVDVIIPSDSNTINGFVRMHKG